VVRIVFGQAWAPAAPIFTLLAIAGMAMLPGYGAAWLFTALGRADAMLRAGLVNAAICLACFAVGLSLGGVTGLAAALALGTHLLVAPLLWLALSRVGPVGFADQARLQLPLLAGCALGALLVEMLDRVLQMQGPAAVLAALAVCYGSSLLALALLPSGRATLRDALSILSMARRGAGQHHPNQP
jgi:PST family polysaccharide transporter